MQIEEGYGMAVWLRSSMHVRRQDAQEKQAKY